jgi:hypothetical protein
MSEENVEFAYPATEAFRRRDLDGFLAVMAEEVRADPCWPRSRVATGAAMESAAGWKAFWTAS